MADRPKRLEDLPPKIQEAMKRKGWTYPPSEEMKRQWKEADERLIGRVATEPDLLEELYREMGWNWLERAKKLPRRP
ncbi:hypothetical protein [Fervidibacter sacchari]